MTIGVTSSIMIKPRTIPKKNSMSDVEVKAFPVAASRVGRWLIWNLKMYRLKSTADISFLLGVCFEQLCVSSGALTINGDNRISIKIFGGFAVSTSGKAYIRYNGAIDDAVALLPLIGSSVVAAEATIEGGLQIKFSSGAVLVIFDDSDQFESFTIEQGEKIIVV